MSNSNNGALYVISAPSGAGKGTVISRMLENQSELHLSVSVTTRAPRKGEIDGETYFFVTNEKFQHMIEAGEFLEYAEFVSEYYGTPKKPIYEALGRGMTVLLEIEVLGARQIMAKDPEAVTIFIIPPSMDELERRLRGRGTDSEANLIKRLERARFELEEQGDYDYVVVNDNADRAAAEILAIIDSKAK